MRLIDADALKKDIEENAIELGGVLAIEVPCAKVLIDSAPTITVDNEIERQREEMYQESKRLYYTARMLGVERPHGEWKLVSDICNDINVVCPFCGNTRIFAYAHGYSIEEVEAQLREVNDLPNYCENCGAKMVKRTEE